MREIKDVLMRRVLSFGSIQGPCSTRLGMEK